MEEKIENTKDWIVECAVCQQRYTNWVGSTECCGSIAYIVNDDGSVSTGSVFFASRNGEDIGLFELGFPKIKY